MQPTYTFDDYVATEDFKRIVRHFQLKFGDIRSDAEVEQIVYIALWDTVKKFDPTRGVKFSTFLFRNVYYEHSHYKDIIFRNRPITFTELQYDNSDYYEDRSFDNVDLQEAVNKLPEKTRVAIKLKFLKNHTYEEIGRITKCTKENARLRVVAGLKKLKYAIS